MELIKRNFFIFTVIVIFLLSLVTDWFYELSVIFLVVTVVTILDKLGKGIVLRELVVLHGVFCCLVIPIFGYEVYTRNNHLARIFVKYMLVPKEEYFHFVLPGMAAFAIAICWPVTKNKQILDEGEAFRRIINTIKVSLKGNNRIGMILVGIGTIVSFGMPYMPPELKFIASLFYSASFAGLLYIHYSPTFRYKKLIFFSFTLFLVWTAVQTGVFTVVAYMGITLFSFFFLGRRQAFWKKLLVCMVCIFLLFWIQTIKNAYRQISWKQGFSGNKTDLFSDIAIDKLQNLDELLNKDALFPVYLRLNQGYNITLVMRRIPDVQDFDNGKRLAIITASSLVPRVLWPDKPQAGGKDAMLYFAGIYINGWSTNVSPIGEAYGSFGVPLGIVFLFVLGAFVRWIYRKVFTIAWKVPLLILWIPVLFFEVTYSLETDTLQILNSLLKSAFFVWVLYKAIPSWFGTARKKGLSHLVPTRRNITA